jgi:TonB family protein
MTRKLATLKVLWVLALPSFIASISLHAQTIHQVEQDLQSQYKGKVFLLRNFYDGPSLHFDTKANILGVWSSGDWTVDGVVRVEDVRLTDSSLSIQARRLHMGWLVPSGFSDVPDQKPSDGNPQNETRTLNIEADLAANAPAISAETLMMKIFLTAQDSFTNMVPDYWRPCVVAALSSVRRKQYSACQFSEEFIAIPGVALNGSENLQEGEVTSSSGPQPYKIGHGITAPKIKLHFAPPYSEQARRAQYQGAAALLIVVNQAGEVRNIHVAKPIGLGLDQRAVETVSKWQFEPGEKDGKPVNIMMAVEIVFHLY